MNVGIVSMTKESGDVDSMVVSIAKEACALIQKLIGLTVMSGN